MNMFTGLSPTDILVVLGSLILSVGLHEAMHAFVAHKLGDRTAYDQGRVTLNPLKHIDILTTVLLPFVLIIMGVPPIFAAKPVPFNAMMVRYGEYGVALVGLAGPFTNLALAAIAALILRSGAVSGTDLFNPVVIFTQINIGLFVFNMIPFPPLDGSRLLYAFAPDFLRRIMEQIEAMGFMILLFAIILLYQFIAPVISNISEAIFLFLVR
jgi:Zn-dependent protease